jgi:NodT family efflux transporter outer membrane factor (OMF) lipoprotein
MRDNVNSQLPTSNSQTTWLLETDGRNSIESGKSRLRPPCCADAATRLGVGSWRLGVRSALGVGRWWLGVCVFTLSGCAIGPRYSPPQVSIPSAYKEQVAGSLPLAPADPRDQVSRDGWWQLFGDTHLNDLETQLIRANPTLAEAEARVRQARALVRQERAGYFPTVAATSSATRARSSAGTRASENSATTSALTEYSLGSQASWEPDLWGRVRQSVAAGTASAQAAVGDLASSRLSLGAELADDYFELRAADAELVLFDETIDAYQRSATLTRNQYDAGIVSRADVEQADTQLAAAQAQASDVRLQCAQLEHAIAVLIGEPPAALTLAAAPLERDPPLVPGDVPSRTLERRPDIAASERRIAAANAQIGVASTAFFPSVLLGATGGFQGTGLQQWLSWPMRFWSVGPSIATTLFDGGARRAVKAQAVAGYDQTVAEYRQTVLSAFQEVEDNLASEGLLTDESEHQRAAVASAQRSLDISLNQYRAGLVSYLQVATQQTALLTNQREALSVMERRYVAAVQLVRALGGGWNGDLNIN